MGSNVSIHYIHGHKLIDNSDIDEQDALAAAQKSKATNETS
jgi:hypothetical protein